MKLPRVRFTVRRMMIAVAVVALNFGLIRGAEELTRLNSGLVILSAYALVPSLSLLTVAAVNAGLGLVKYGKASAFSTGYLLLGGLVSFGICLDLATQSFILDAITVTIINDSPASETTSNIWLSYILLILAFASPQVIIASIGGGLANRYGLTIVRAVRSKPDLAAISVTDDV
jgi:hypothetical protein